MPRPRPPAPVCSRIDAPQPVGAPVDASRPYTASGPRVESPLGLVIRSISAWAQFAVSRPPPFPLGLAPRSVCICTPFKLHEILILGGIGKLRRHLPRLYCQSVRQWTGERSPLAQSTIHAGQPTGKSALLLRCPCARGVIEYEAACSVAQIIGGNSLEMLALGTIRPWLASIVVRIPRVAR